MRARKTSPYFMMILATLIACIVLAGANSFQAGQSGLNVGAMSALSFSEHFSLVQAVVGQAKEATISWVTDHYQRVPTLMLGLAALILFPVISIVSALIQSVSARSATTQSPQVKTERTATHAFGAKGNAKPVSDRIACKAGRPVWPSKAMVELRDPTGQRHPARIPLSQPVVQIGRSDDADIIIQDPTVHRHHATIHCTEDAEYMVTDMSAGTGNGVVVNGHPVFQHQIFDGDEIRLGRARLMFLTAQR